MLHLFDYNRFREEYEVPSELTQSGIANAVGIRIQHVSQYAKPLTREGLVEETIRHIRRSPRRRKVYFLTARGRHHVASLRSALLRETVPLRTLGGKTKRLPLSRVYQEERMRESLLALLKELRDTGRISESRPQQTGNVIEYMDDAPEAGRFYGRDREIGDFLEKLGRTPATVILGPAGIGKTALGVEICQRLRGKRSLFWKRVRPWNGIADLGLRLASFLRSHGRPELYAYMTGTHSRTLGRMEEVIAAEFSGLPCLLVFDDVHRSSEESTQFLSVLLEALSKQGEACILLLSRVFPDIYGRREVTLERTVSEIVLGELDQQSCVRLLAGAGVDETRWSDILRTGGGNPLFLNLVARAGRRGGTHTGRETLETYLAEEIEPVLSEEERICLEVASLLELPVPSRALSLGETASKRTVLGLHKKTLLNRTAEDRYQLHDFLRDYFRHSMPGSRKRDLVQHVAPWLVEEANTRAQQGNPQDAVALVENALFIETDRAMRLKSLERLGELRRYVGDFNGAIAAFHNAMELAVAEEGEDRARLHGRTAAVELVLWHLDAAEKEVEMGLQLLPTAPSIDVGWLLLRKAAIDSYRGKLGSALGYVERVRSWLPDSTSDPNLWAELAMLRGMIHLSDHVRRDPAVALRDFQSAREAWEAVGNRRGVARAEQSIGLAFQYLGHGKEALEHFDRSAAEAKAVGDLPARVRALFSKAWFLLTGGDLDAAEALFLDTFELSKDLHPQYRLLWQHLHFARLYWLQGRLEEARESLEYFLEAGSEMLDAESRMAYLTGLVRLCAQCEDYPAAEVFLLEARRLSIDLPTDYGNFRFKWAKASLLACQGDENEARRFFQEAKTLLAEGRRGDILEESIVSAGTRGEFLLEYGRFLVSIRKTRQARAILRDSQDFFKEDRMMLLEKEADELLQAVG